MKLVWRHCESPKLWKQGEKWNVWVDGKFHTLNSGHLPEWVVATWKHINSFFGWTPSQ